MLDRIAGQPAAVALLHRALASGRVAHAYAFVGPAGSGRTATAIAFAQALLCEGPAGARRDADACGRCRGCRMVAGSAHPDFHRIVPTPPAANPKGPRAVRIDAVRELERKAFLRPVMAPRKVFVIEEADRMTEDTPQAFLKTLEEPPDRTVMILVLSRARVIPATVLSRCQLVRFRAPETAPPAEADEAQALLAQVESGGMASVFTKGERFDRQKAEGLVDAYWLWCRDLLLAKVGAPETLLMNRSRAADVARAAQAWSVDEIMAAIDVCRKAREALEYNVTPRLTIDVVLSRLAGRAA
jgi:DNA polymerase III subunit delta'